MKVSEHFSREEFKCKCCGEVKLDVLLLDILEDIRSHFGQKVIINSGYRCNVHNSEIGGVPTSQHLLGKACDIVVENIAPYRVQEYLREEHPHRFGIGSYDTFTHIDVRKEKARW